MRSKEQLLNIIIGQLEGARDMMTSQGSCLAVLTQIKAARASLGHLSNRLIEEDVLSCVGKTAKAAELKELFKEIIKNN